MATEVSPVANEARPPTEAGASVRLASLDAFRGFTMLWIIGATAVVASLCRAIGDHPVVNALANQFRHSSWEGLRYWDLIWPSFMLMVGVSLPFAHARHALSQSRREMLVKALRRAVILFLLGSLRGSVATGAPEWIELSSALQPIALAYFVAFLLVEKPVKYQTGVAAGILLAYGLLLALVPAPGIGAGSYRPMSNLVTWVDLAVLGRAEKDGWGTVLTAFPPISTTILGALIGRLLMGQRSAGSKLKILAALGTSLLALGWAMGFFVPVIMKLWTSSYGVLSAGWACLLFLAFYWLIDVRGYRKWAFPLTVIGMNAIAIYVGKGLVHFSAIAGIFSKGLAAHMGAFGPGFNAACVVAVEWLVLYWMHRRKLFLRP